MTTYGDRDAFYSAYPDLSWTHYPGAPPAGIDVRFGKKFLMTICCSEQASRALNVQEVPGTLVAFEHTTGEIHVLRHNITCDAALEWLKTPAGIPWAM